MLGKDILNKARPHVGEQYVFGASVSYRNANWKGPWDCAEFATWCVFQTYDFFFGCDAAGTAGSAFTGQWRQDAQTRGRMIPAEEAIKTPGAFLLRFPGSGSQTIGHIVISVGDGSTIEAADSTHGVIAGTVFGRRWDTGVLLPDVEYQQREPGTTEPSRTQDLPNPDDHVKEIQLALREKGFDPGPIDGLFGEMTENAVAAFQASVGLIVDGEVGPNTDRELFGDKAGARLAPKPTAPGPMSAGPAPTQPIASKKYEDLKDEYLSLYATLVPSAQRKKDIEAAASRVLAGRGRYQSVASALGAIPWYVIGVINELESTSKFTTHLHNGDSLSDRTVHVPSGRPPGGTPPFTWEQSAQDALTMQNFDRFTDWSLSRILHRLEGYNGFGSRAHGVFTPYLFSGCQHFTKGKFTADGRFDPNAPSSQIGCSVIMKVLQGRGEIEMDMR